MKIGLAIYNFDPKKGGAERYTCDLAARLKAKGHEVIIFCARARGTEYPGIKIVPLKTIGYPRWLRNLSFAFAHRNALRQNPTDVMLGYGNVFELDVYQSHGGVHEVWMEREIASYRSLGIKSLKPFLLRSSLNQAIQGWIEGYPVRLKRFSRIIAISDMVKDHMSSHFGIDPDRFDIVYNGVDTERFSPSANPPQGPVTILFCAANFRLKGLGPLLKAFAKVVRQGKDIRLTVMGRGNTAPYIPIIEKENIRNRVNFIGETSRPEEIYRQSHILAHPTYYDACSLTTMEGMASGLPVITTRWNGASAFVSPDDGFVIDEPEDIDGLCAAILELCDEDRRVIMGNNARKKMEQFTMNRNAEEIESVLIRAQKIKEAS